MKKILILFLLVFTFNSCGSFFSDFNKKNSEKTVDTALMKEYITSFEVEKIDFAVVFQVFDDIVFDDDFQHNCKTCLCRTYIRNENKKSKWDWETKTVNNSALVAIFDENKMLYDGLEINANDFIMIGTFTYLTEGGNTIFGIKIEPREITVPVYAIKSELLKIYNSK